MPNRYEPAERAVIGAALLNPDRIDDLLPILGTDGRMFSGDDHGVVWEAICSLHSDRRPVTIVALMDRLGGRLEGIGGAVALADYERACETSHYCEDFAHTVAQGHRERLLEQQAKRALASIKAGAFDADAMGEFVVAVSEIAEDGDQGGPSPVGDGLPDLLAHVQQRREHGSAITGARTGIDSVDKMLRGLRPGTLTVVAARPGVGKTAIGINMAVNAAADDNPVLFFSLEMGRLEINERIVSLTTGRSFDDLCDSTGAETKNAILSDAVALIGQLPLQIDDSAGLTVWQMRTRIRRWARKHKGVKHPVVLVDYLQLFRGDSRQPRHDFLASITRELKILAGELGIAVVALCQLGREAAGETDPFRCTSRLKESGSIEQDADAIVVALADLPEELADALRGSGIPDYECLNAAVVKNRQGRTGACPLRFRKSTQQITDLFTEATDDEDI